MKDNSLLFNKAIKKKEDVMKKIKVLITHVSYQASAGSFIKLLRNSQKYSFYIVGCDAIEKGYSSGSMLVDKFYRVPSNDAPQYIETVEKIIICENIDVIISAEEEDLILFKSQKIDQALYKYIPQQAIFDLFKDKYFATQELSKRGISIPSNIMNYEQFIKSSSEKIIKRKRVSCSSRGITIYSKSDITRDFNFFSDEYMTQEFLSGKMYTVDVFCDKKGIPASIIPRRILASKDGTTFKCVIERQQELINICQQIYSFFCLPGLTNIQFIVTDKPYFIELNPRAAATMIASAISSINYMDLYVSHFLFNESLPPYDEIMNSVKWGSIISRYYQETIFLPGDIKDEQI